MGSPSTRATFDAFVEALDWNGPISAGPRSPGLRNRGFGRRLSRCRYTVLRAERRKWWKRHSARLVRRLGKLDPEHAPTKIRYSGWAG
jgi:hypothetical protein